MLNLNVSNEEELGYEFNLGQNKTRLTLPTVNPELVNAPDDPPCSFIEELSMLIKYSTACGINSRDEDITNLSNEAITAIVDHLMMDNLMPAWTIGFREDTTVDIFWYWDGVPGEWKTTVPPFGTKRMRTFEITEE